MSLGVEEPPDDIESLPVGGKKPKDVLVVLVAVAVPSPIEFDVVAVVVIAGSVFRVVLESADVRDSLPGGDAGFETTVLPPRAVVSTMVDPPGEVGDGISVITAEEMEVGT